MNEKELKLILKALNFAAQKHKDQRRKDAAASPYINHPIGLANILCNEGYVTEIEVICAALLHDTIGVTDFTDYSTTTGKWGNTTGLYGPIYSYQGPDSTMTAKVDATERTLHATGSVAPGDYAGTGLSFAACATVADFTQVQFTISGSIGDCALELQLKTFDQTPTTGDPPGGCDSSADCYGYPALKQIVVPTSTATEVVKPLMDFTSWSEANAKQLVGLQWQVTKAPATDPDAGTSCDVDIQLDDIKFLP